VGVRMKNSSSISRLVSIAEPWIITWPLCSLLDIARNEMRTPFTSR